MVVTNKNIYEDAKKVVEAVLTKQQDPRNPLKPERVYVGIASCYNGDRPKLNRQIFRIAEMYGVNGLVLVDFLNQAYQEFESERKALGDRRQYAYDEQATLKALKLINGGNNLENKIVGNGELDDKYVREAETRLEAFFASV
ncbi:MAG: hypothetical protein QXF25_00780 [Candidatus Pacearchaeota archaeon]